MKDQKINWLLWVCSVFGLTCLVANFATVGDLEYFWHLTLGRMTERFQLVPASNHFTYTLPAETPVAVSSWLSRWWLYKLEVAIGTAGVLAIRAVLLGVSAVLVFGAVARRAQRFAPAAFVTSAVLLVSLGVTLGPPIFGVLLVSIVAAVCAAILDGRSPRWFFALAFLVPFWVNIDTSFWVVPALILVSSVHAAGPVRRLGLAAALLAFALSFVNPTLGSVWVGALAQPLVWDVGGLVLVAVACLVLWMGRSTSSRTDWEWVGLAGLAAVMGHPAIVGVLCAVAMANALGELTQTIPVLSKRAVVFVTGVLVSAAVLSSPAWVFTQGVRIALMDVRPEAPLRGLLPTSVPLDAADVAAAWGATFTVFHSPEYAGLLHWKLTDGRPQTVLFDAPNTALRPASVDALRRSLTQGDTWRGVFQQNQIQAALLALPGDREMAEALAMHPDWEVVIEAPDYVLLAKRGGPGAKR